MSDGRSDLLRDFLDSREVPCPGCGYNLRDLHGSRCPECGDDLILQVGLAEPRQAAVIAGLMGLAAGAGMSGLLIGYAGIVSMFRLYGGPPVSFMVLTIGGFLVEGGALGIWLGFWRRIRRLPRGTKALLVAGCWGLTILNLVVFSLFVR
jgi:hypothetical protein